MTTQTVDGREIVRAEKEVAEAIERLRQVRLAAPDEEVKDYELLDGEGRGVMLSSLFGDKSDLILIHNMGSSCAYCTMWADGFNGSLGAIQDRAAFALVSPDSPETQRKFADGRGWNFPMFSASESSFTGDMGYVSDTGGAQPGCSVFKKDDEGKILRVTHTPFGPGDLYNGIWHLFDLLDGGPGGWGPKFKY